MRASLLHLVRASVIQCKLQQVAANSIASFRKSASRGRCALTVQTLMLAGSIGTPIDALPIAGASRREKSRHDLGSAHRSQLAKLPASSCCRPESAFSRVRQPKAVIKRPIQHRAALLLDTLTSLLHFTTVSEWWTRIKLIPSH